MKISALLILVFTGSLLFAQYEGNNIAIYGSPQYLIKSGLRIDIDIKKPNSKSWWSLSPYYYFDNREIEMLDNGYGEYDQHDYDQLQGFGLGLEKRTFLLSKNYVEGLYLRYGVIYKHFNIEGNNHLFREYTGDDGLTYMKLMPGNYEVNIHSSNVVTAFGYNLEVSPNLILDLYIGFGIKYSIHKSPQNASVKYNRNYIDYGFTGMHLIGGFKVGVVL